MEIAQSALRLARSVTARSRLCVGLFSLAALLVLMAIPTRAEEISPLRKDREFAHGIFRTMQRLGEMGYRIPGLPARHAFNAIAPEVMGVNSLARFGLSQNSIDVVSLSNFAREVIENRLSELQVSDEIVIKRPRALDVIRQVDCELLRLDFLVEGSELEVAGRRTVVVVVDLWAWQDARIRLSDGTKPCIDSTSPLVQRDARRTFVVQAGEREEALKQLREQIISIIDTAVLLRVVVANRTALETVRLWAEGAN